MTNPNPSPVRLSERQKPVARIRRNSRREAIAAKRAFLIDGLSTRT
jgi:hypothetical protein